MAMAPAAAKSLREQVRCSRGRRHGARQHKWFSLLDAPRVGMSPENRRDIGRLRISGRDGFPRATRGPSYRRDSNHVHGSARRTLENVGQGYFRVDAKAMAASSWKVIGDVMAVAEQLHC